MNVVSLQDITIKNIHETLVTFSFAQEECSNIGMEDYIFINFDLQSTMFNHNPIKLPILMHNNINLFTPPLDHFKILSFDGALKGIGPAGYEGFFLDETSPPLHIYASYCVTSTNNIANLLA